MVAVSGDGTADGVLPGWEEGGFFAVLSAGFAGGVPRAAPTTQATFRVRTATNPAAPDRQRVLVRLMDPLSELVKVGIAAYMSYMRQNGLTEDEINKVFEDVKKEMFARDPANIPG